MRLKYKTSEDERGSFILKRIDPDKDIEKMPEKEVENEVEGDYKDLKENANYKRICTYLGAIGIIFLCVWFSISVLCISLNVVFCIFPSSPASVIGEVVNQTREYLVVELQEEYVRADVLVWPKNGMYPETRFLGFWPNIIFSGDRIDLTDEDPIEGEYIEIYTIDEEFYGVGQYCKDKNSRGDKFGYFRCNEMTTNLVYYFTDGYQTSVLSIIVTILYVGLVIILLIIALALIILPIGASIEIYYGLIHEDESILS